MLKDSCNLPSISLYMYSTTLYYVKMVTTNYNKIQLSHNHLSLTFLVQETLKSKKKTVYLVESIISVFRQKKKLGKRIQGFKRKDIQKQAKRFSLSFGCSQQFKDNHNKRKKKAQEKKQNRRKNPAKPPCSLIIETPSDSKQIKEAMLQETLASQYLLEQELVFYTTQKKIQESFKSKLKGSWGGGGRERDSTHLFLFVFDPLFSSLMLQQICMWKQQQK